MKKVTEIHNTNIGIYANDSYLIYQQDGNVIQYDLEASEEQILFTTDFETHSIHEIEDSVFLVGSKGFQEYRNNSLRFSDREIGDYDIYGNQYIYSTIDYDYKNYLPKSACIDIFSNEEIWSGEFGETIKSNTDKTFSISNIKLSKRNQKTGEIEWEFEYEKTNYVPSLIIGKNYTLLGIPERDQLICLENNTGNKQWQQNTIPKGILIDDQEELFHQFMVNYNCISLINGSMIKQRIDREYFRDIGIENQKDNFIQLENTLLVNESRTKTIGRFNIDTLNFEWIEKGQSIPAGYKMKKNRNFVFLVNSEKILTIYKWKTG